MSVIGLSSVVSYPRVDKCLRKNLVPFTDEAKMEFLHFIEQLQKQTSELQLLYTLLWCDWTKWKLFLLLLFFSQSVHLISLQPLLIIPTAFPRHSTFCTNPWSKILKKGRIKIMKVWDFFLLSSLKGFKEVTYMESLIY